MDNEPNFEGEKMKMPTQSINPNRLGGKSESSKGIFIVLLFIALAVILIGLFYWYQSDSVIPPPPSASRPTAEMNKEPETTNATAQVESLSALSTSDEILAIEADIESTNLDSLEAELGQIDAELEAALVP